MHSQYREDTKQRLGLVNLFYKFLSTSLKALLGIFAGKRIPSGTFVGIYAGEIITDEEGERRGRWVTLRL